MIISSWIIKRKDTDQPVLETFNKKILSKLNTKKYYYQTALEHLASLNH